MGVRISFEDSEIREMFAVGDGESIDEIEVFWDNILKQWVMDAVISKEIV